MHNVLRVVRPHECVEFGSYGSKRLRVSGHAFHEFLDRAAPAGGGGELRPTKANSRPTKCSGGHVANAIRPPALSTRRISVTAIPGRGANIWPNWLTTRSNDASG